MRSPSQKLELAQYASVLVLRRPYTEDIVSRLDMGSKRCEAAVSVVRNRFLRSSSSDERHYASFSTICCTKPAPFRLDSPTLVLDF